MKGHVSDLIVCTRVSTSMSNECVCTVYDMIVYLCFRKISWELTGLFPSVETIDYLLSFCH
jgi:hypothetical protein